MRDIFLRLKKVVLRVFIFCFFGSLFLVILFRFVPVPFTPLMIIRCFEQWSNGKEIKMAKDWTNLDELGTALPLAVIAAEDQNFEEHFGFDLEAIEKAGRYNKSHHGQRLKGASTITQQTAKNVFLWPSRSWIRKGFEVYFAFLIELFWSKERIMEVYLNVIETGDGIYGAEKAGEIYFHKPAKSLSVKEASKIATVLPDPRRLNPSKLSGRALKKSQRIVKYMGRLKPVYF